MESAERLRKVEVSSRESSSTLWVSIARGCRKSSRECAILSSGKISLESRCGIIVDLMLETRLPGRSNGYSRC